MQPVPWKCWSSSNSAQLIKCMATQFSTWCSAEDGLEPRMLSQRLPPGALNGNGYTFISENINTWVCGGFGAGHWEPTLEGGVCDWRLLCVVEGGVPGAWSITQPQVDQYGGHPSDSGLHSTPQFTVNNAHWHVCIRHRQVGCGGHMTRCWGRGSRDPSLGLPGHCSLPLSDYRGENKMLLKYIGPVSELMKGYRLTHPLS